METGKLRWATYRFDPYDRHNLVNQHRNLVLYPLSDRKPVQFSKDRCDVVEFEGFGDHPCRGVLNSLELPNDAVSGSNQ